MENKEYFKLLRIYKPCKYLYQKITMQVFKYLQNEEKFMIESAFILELLDDSPSCFKSLMR